VAKSAGLTQIDYMVVTHYDADHVGGVKDVGERVPIKSFVDHGPRIPGEAFGAAQRGAAPAAGGTGTATAAPGGTANAPAAASGGGAPAAAGRGSAFSNDRIDAAYAEARAKGRHIEVKVGDKVPIKGLDVQIVSAQGDVISK